MNGYVLSILLYEIESCTFPSQIKRAHEVADVVLGELFRISWTEHLNEEAVLRQIETKQKKRILACRIKTENVEGSATE